MGYYNDEIADNDKVELILMAGEGDDTLKAWAAKVEMPWPMIKQKDQARMRPLKELTPRGWPTYYLIDAEGEVLAKGVGNSAPVKAKLKELLEADNKTVA